MLCPRTSAQELRAVQMRCQTKAAHCSWVALDVFASRSSPIAPCSAKCWSGPEQRQVIERHSARNHTSEAVPPVAPSHHAQNLSALACPDSCASRRPSGRTHGATIAVAAAVHKRTVSRGPRQGRPSILRPEPRLASRGRHKSTRLHAARRAPVAVVRGPFSRRPGMLPALLH
jgi:hypothetical protein